MVWELGLDWALTIAQPTPKLKEYAEYHHTTLHRADDDDDQDDLVAATQRANDTHRSSAYGPSEIHSKRSSSTSPPLPGSLEAGPGNFMGWGALVAGPVMPDKA